MRARPVLDAGRVSVTQLSREEIRPVCYRSCDWLHGGNFRLRELTGLANVMLGGADDVIEIAEAVDTTQGFDVRPLQAQDLRAAREQAVCVAVERRLDQ
jgi:hypothetical protein